MQRYQFGSVFPSVILVLIFSVIFSALLNWLAQPDKNALDYAVENMNAHVFAIYPGTDPDIWCKAKTENLRGYAQCTATFHVPQTPPVPQEVIAHCLMEQQAECKPI